MALEKEMETYKKMLPELKEKNAGKYALIQDDKFIDVFSAYEDAIKEGYKQCGLKPFLVKKIEIEETIQSITRLIDPQCPSPHSA